MRILLFGATGLVGGKLLELALADPAISQVIAPTRKPLSHHDKLCNPIERNILVLLPEVVSWKADVLIWAAGTTMRTARSKAEFYRVDHDLPLAFSQAAQRNGTGVMVFLSAQGASSQSWFFYLQTKARTEEDLQSLGFRSLMIMQPGFISGSKTRNTRSFERVLELLSPILPRSLQATPVCDVARVALEAARTVRSGVTRSDGRTLPDYC